MAAVTVGVSVAASAQAPVPAAALANGPAPPVSLDVMARDGEGRVTVRAVQIAAPLRLDGVLDDDVYRTVRPIDSFLQQEPRFGEPVSETTRVWVLFDRDYLYVSAQCGDSRSVDPSFKNEFDPDAGVDVKYGLAKGSRPISRCGPTLRRSKTTISR